MKILNNINSTEAKTCLNDKRQRWIFSILGLWLNPNSRENCLYYGLFTWNGGRRSSGVGFFCFHALEDTKQKKPTPLDRGPPLHVNRVLEKRNLAVQIW